MQWSAANVRILLELLREGTLQTQQIFDYLAYTVHISELAGVYKWVSVLQYDNAYRQRQAQEGFRWGADVPHLDKIHLRVREKPVEVRKQDKWPTKQVPVSNYAARQGKPDGEQDYCRLYQRDACPYGDSCRYPHVCAAETCRGTHPLSQHGKPEQGNANRRG
jgi:hypothetical protein